MITITNEIIGQTELHSHKENPERIEMVPLYKMIFKEKIFSVTRDTNHNNFYKKTKGNFSTNSECPPGNFKATIRKDGEKGPRIQLYEEGIDNGSGSLLKGKGETIRSHIQIHKGKWSTGCFLVQEHKEFQELVNNLKESHLEVNIEPR